ncbi:MAG: WD40/YVTN/BNR-like repeat-containing protein [Acidimicrobiales bacterium]
MNRSTRRTVAGVGGALLGVVVSVAATTGTAAAGSHSQSRDAIQGARTAAPVPKGFKANSITWLSSEQGYVLGTVPCGTTKVCTEVIGTTDGAKTWSEVGAIKAPIANTALGGEGISEIRFATANDGWAFGPDLYRTTDGGRTWVPETIPGKGAQVLDLAANTTEAYAVVSDCAHYCSKQFSFWRTTSLAKDSWAQIHLNLPGALSADVAVWGKTVYLLDEYGQIRPHEDKLFASTDGLHFSARPAPCDTSPLPIELIQVVPSSATDVTLLCDGDPATSQADKYAYRSTDTGKTDTSAGTMGLPGIQAQLAVSSSGNIAVSAQSDGSFIFINDNHKTSWTQVVGDSDGGVGFNDVVYVTDSEAWVVYAPDERSLSQGQLWETTDGGRHWNVETP